MKHLPIGAVQLSGRELDQTKVTELVDLLLKLAGKDPLQQQLLAVATTAFLYTYYAPGHASLSLDQQQKMAEFMLTELSSKAVALATDFVMLQKGEFKEVA